MARQGSTGNVLAAICSFFIPGLGQLVQGRVGMAAGCLAFPAPSALPLPLLSISVSSISPSPAFSSTPCAPGRPFPFEFVPEAPAECLHPRPYLPAPFLQRIRW